ncbi:MAG: HD domain-containing protein [Bacilli bacterium]|nr:HD domain-containing protein [Bacilli bacterium]
MIFGNRDDKEKVYLDALKTANTYNLKVLVVMVFLSILALVLDEIGVFATPRTIMLIASFVSVGVFLVPIIIYFVHDKLLKKENPIIETNLLKIIIIVASFLGVTCIIVTLAFHVLLGIGIPMLMAAQYRNNKKLITAVFIASMILVPISVYGTFFFGTIDRNILKIATEDIDKYSTFTQRLELATSKRMLELFLHYVLPRALCVVAMEVLVIGIINRNKLMLEKQGELSEKVQREMQHTSEIQLNIIEDLAAVVETRDCETGEHIARTKQYVNMIANILKKNDKYKDVLDEKTIDQYTEAAPLHDVGKIAISDTILLKPGKLTPEEYEQMKVHTTKGGEMIYKIFKNLKDEAFIKHAHDIALYHHEKWDGTGYPEGIKGEEIPLSARIMAIADVYDALVSKRVYKDAMDPNDAFDILEKDAGSHFDPNIIEIIKEYRKDFVDSVK